MAAAHDPIDYADLTRLVPVHLRPGLRRYIEEGVRSGDALWSILCNAPAFEVAARVDDMVLPRLREIYSFLYGYAPSDCWGSEAKCQAWLDRGGLRGKAG